MEDAIKGSSCSSSMDGTTAMDVDGDEDNVLWIVLCAGDKLLWTEVGWRE